jgi:Fe-S-cluster-containing hydrogenase component 2
MRNAGYNEAMSDSLLGDLAEILDAHGLMLRGGFHPTSADGLGPGVATVLLVGNAGPAMWQAFSRAVPESADPLDAWTRATVDDVATRFGARAAYPFDGPPYWPFQRWAMRCDDVHPSPIGVLIHPRYGPWHAYRAALLVAEPVDLPQAARGPAPCAACTQKPCLGACPVGAFADDGYDVPACAAHIRSESGTACMARGCLARHACPVGAEYRYADAQSAFHMAAFERARPATSRTLRGAAIQMQPMETNEKARQIQKPGA